MRKILEGLIFLLGWVLSPFTWWNDALVNLPLSYLLAKLLFYFTCLPLRWLVLCSYIFTNLLGLFLMYFGGKHFLTSAANRMKAVAMLVIFIVVYSALMLYLDRQGKLLPLNAFAEKYCVAK